MLNNRNSSCVNDVSMFSKSLVFEYEICWYSENFVETEAKDWAVTMLILLIPLFDLCSLDHWMMRANSIMAVLYMKNQSEVVLLCTVQHSLTLFIVLQQQPLTCYNTELMVDISSFGLLLCICCWLLSLQVYVFCICSPWCLCRANCYVCAWVYVCVRKSRFPCCSWGHCKCCMLVS